ncbi:MAG: hypothetical protein JOZ78_04485 [Chroococcidiopsidaceae cyanobacterium CP_BM_ER_R8_30]|nr:hypothetical protein [Chroococcidiopsidaceae cyanobacterium CP_BM_ER_R8_30]
MKTLLTLFRQERSALETEIEQTTSRQHVVRLIQSKIDTLEQSYISQLSVNQVRLVKSFIDTLRQSIAAFTAAGETTDAASGPERIVNQAPRVNRFILKLLQVLASLGIFASSFSLTQDNPSAWMVILLMSLLVGLEVVLQFSKDDSQARLNMTKSSCDPPCYGGSSSLTQPVKASQSLVQVDSKLLLDDLAEAFSSIDRVVAQTAGVQKLGSSEIEEMPQLLDFLQQLWGASFLQNPQMTLELTKLIPQVLLEQGIRIQAYQHNNEHCREYFDFEPSIDRSNKDYVTIAPALLKGERLLRRGRVIEPAQFEVRA